MAKVANISPEESIRQNLDTWCFEVGSQFEEYSVKSAERFLKYIKKQAVIDLGSGDGAATRVFIENGNPTTAVDINQDKLDKIIGAKKVQADFVSFLSKPVDNLFFHHALEHCPNPDEVLELIGKHLKKDKYCYIAVPKNDHPHSVHHVAFESLDEIIPPGLEIIEGGESDNPTWPEYFVIAKKK